MEKELAEAGNNFSEGLVALDCRDAAMGKGDEELFEKKLSKEEKKALAKAKRDAKKAVRDEQTHPHGELEGFVTQPFHSFFTASRFPFRLKEVVTT